MNVAIIPARGGSKRIPRKNIKVFAGKPMIAWSIEAAISSGCFEKVIVSTDDKEISDIANDYGAETPFVRPRELADDYAGTVPVIRHAIEWLSKFGKPYKNVCCIYATAPFVSPDDIKIGLDAISRSNTDFAFSVTRYAYPIQRALRINGPSNIEMLNPHLFNTRSQDLEEAYHDAGQFYWGRAKSWIKNETILGDKTSPIILPRYRVQDIDTKEDWRNAELMFKAIQHERSLRI